MKPSTCKKRRYATRKLAQQFARKAEAREGMEPGELRAFPCRHCGGWHLTSQEQKTTGQKVKR